jgi:NAD(P)-dependent dehydrogenase (short-subunit alcohol dehydrogenase family)
VTVAIVTGASRGLGRELASELAGRGWSLVIDARDPSTLAAAEAALRRQLRADAQLVALTGDVTDPDHRRALVAAAEAMGGLDLLVNNASTLGATPLPPLERYPLESLRLVFEHNVVAPLALAQLALPLLRRSPDPRIVNVSSDAAVEAYEGWGGYGISKAALDHLGRVLHVEQPDVRLWAIDPGDMQTQMHQDAFPGQDISDRPLPAHPARLLATFIESDQRSGRYRIDDLALAER